MVHRFFRRGPLSILRHELTHLGEGEGWNERKRDSYILGWEHAAVFFPTSINWNIFAVDNLTTEMRRLCSWGARAWQAVACPTAKLRVLVVIKEGRGQAKSFSCLNLRLSYLISKFKTSDTHRQTVGFTPTNRHRHTGKRCLWLVTSEAVQFNSTFMKEGCKARKFACGVANEAGALSISSVSLETECCLLIATTSQLLSPQATSKRKFS